MIHAAMEPAQVVSDVQIKSLLGIQSHIIRASQKNWSLQGMDGFHGVWLVDSCKALNAPDMEGLQRKKHIQAWACPSSLLKRRIWYPGTPHKIWLLYLLIGGTQVGCYSGTSLPAACRTSYDTSMNQIPLANPSYALLRMASKSSPLRLMQMEFQTIIIHRATFRSFWRNSSTKSFCGGEEMRWDEVTTIDM